jgi:hypothetical protein
MLAAYTIDFFRAVKLIASTATFECACERAVFPARANACARTLECAAALHKAVI